MGSAFKHFNLDTVNCKTFSVRAPKHGGNPSVSLKYTVDICAGMPKKSLGMKLLYYMIMGQ